MRFTPQMRALDWLVSKPIAHRGLHVEANGIVENSESAFANAMAKGLSMECDIQLTADGHAVVFHDDEVERVLDGKGKVKSLTLAQIKHMKFRGGNDRVQTLPEMLEQVAGRETLVIEIKSLWDNDMTLTRHVVDILGHYKGPFAIMSFDENIVACAAELAPNIVRGITADRVTDPYFNILPVERRIAMQSLDHLPRSKPHFISYYFRDLPFQPVGEIRRRGFPIITWTIRSDEEARIARRYSDQITFENYTPT
jgi:glycerophosphoryl diester phosphodiesterase